MPNHSRHRRHALFTPLLVGLLISQLIASAVVYQSNRHLDRKVTALEQAGFLSIPTHDIRPGLSRIGSAFWEGLFFTLSTGAGLTLLTMLAIRIGQLLSKFNRLLPLILLILPVGLLTWMNRNGFNLPATLFITVVPAAVTLFSASGKDYTGTRPSIVPFLSPLVALVILAGAWLTQLDSRLFINIRDFVLLSNPVGLKVNDFYYRYTLYPAEVFKTLSQKTIRSYISVPPDDSPSDKRLHRRMKRFDYLPVEDKEAADIVIRSSGNTLIFEQNGRLLLETDHQDFFNRTRLTLQNLSAQADRFEAFRKVTFFSILFAFPVILFLFIYAGLLRFLTFFLSDNLSAITAAALVLGLGLAPLAALHGAGTASVPKSGLTRMLGSERWQDRVMALRTIDQKKFEIGDFPRYSRMLDSPQMPERYWLARALGQSRKPETYNDLLKLLHDSHSNVVCQAFYGLGQRSNRNAVSFILNKFETLDDWYSQRYGYAALRKLGWTQPGQDR